MARSHGPFAPPGGQPPHWRHGAEPEQPPAPAQPAYPHLPAFIQNAAAAHANGAGYGSPYGQPQPYPGQHGYAPNPYAAPPAAGYGAPGDLRGGTYDWQPQPDPLSYDLANYAPAPAHQRPAGFDGGGQWPQAPAPPEPYAFANPNNLPAESGLYQDEADYEPKEPRRRRRWPVVLTILLAAVGVGGAMAYYYKTVIMPKGGDRAPVVRAAKEPLKVLPDTKRAAETRLNNRLEAGASAGTPEGELDSNGVRRVPTVVVGRDGSVGGPGQAPTQAGPPRQAVAVPGMLIDGLAPRAVAAQPPQQAPQPVAPVARNPMPATAPQSAPQRGPQVIARATPEPAAAPAVAPKAAAKAVVPKQPVAKTAAPATGANGYVAVLSTQKTRMEALKNFADMQQKYASVLQDKIPDVIEADLSARGLGTMYRLVVGPPGSRDAASGVCGQLKSSGYQHCWVTPY